MRWRKVSEQPKKRGFYLCFCPTVPPQSHWAQVVEWRDGDWLTSWPPTHWAVLKKPDGDD